MIARKLYKDQYIYYLDKTTTSESESETSSRISSKTSSEAKNKAETGKKIVDETILNRIKKLCIPPAWINVQISTSDVDYLQATGYDSKGLKQYIYHPVWNTLMKMEKYNRLKDFTRRLPCVASATSKVLNGPIMLDSKEYVAALIFKILQKTHSRIGNDCFAEKNNTYGLTTLLKKHVTVKGASIYISFVGKKNITQQFEFKDPQLSKIMTELLKIPGDRLFKTSKGEHITSADINMYLKDKMKGDFTAKDFRTHAANYLFLKFLLKMEIPTTKGGFVRTANEVYDKVAEELGNTRAVCKTSYVMPIIFEKYSENPSQFVAKNPTLADILVL